MKVVNIEEYVKEHHATHPEINWNKNYIETDDYTLECLEKALLIGVQNIMSDNFLEKEAEPIDHLFPVGFDKVGSSVVEQRDMKEDTVIFTLILNLFQVFERVGVNTAYDKVVIDNYKVGSYEVYILYAFVAKNKIKILI